MSSVKEMLDQLVSALCKDTGVPEDYIGKEVDIQFNKWIRVMVIDEEERIIENINNKDFESMDIDVEYLKTTMNAIIFNSENLLFYVKKLNSPTVYAAFLFEKIETLRSDLREIEKHITEGSLEAPIENTYALPELKIYLKAYLTGMFEILRFKFDLDLDPHKFMYIK